MKSLKNFKLKKPIMYACGSFVIISALCHEHKFRPNYRINPTGHEAFAEYENGSIYIVSSRDQCEKLEPLIGENDIIVIDERNTKDPNMIIYNSYRITSKEQRNSILGCLLEYERLYPTSWDRSIESLRNEWDVHNISYTFKYRIKNSQSVDLNNDDEEKYDSKILTKILFN